MDARLTQEGLGFHAARLLLLISICGKRRNTAASRPALEGRTLLAKLDFFLRYPKYLLAAAEIRRRRITVQDVGLSSADDIDTVESQMVRFRYGPWDHIYYPTLAYMVAKGLIQINSHAGVDVFELTEQGERIAAVLASDESIRPLAKRAEVVRKVFAGFTGNGVKEFIYKNFPDVVGRKIGENI
jgi:hypothetical protein